MIKWATTFLFIYVDGGRGITVVNEKEKCLLGMMMHENDKFGHKVIECCMN